MIPYFGAETVSIFGVFSVRVWGTLVAAGYGLGTYLAWRRAKAKGLDPERVLSLAAWMFAAAMVGARLFHVLVYEPGYYAGHVREAFDPRAPGYAITGGFLGAAAVFFWQMYRRGLDWAAYADVLAWGIPWGCGVGRIGCFLIHDHPGTLSHGLLAVRYPDGRGRHDLGLCLSLAGFATGLLFLALARKRRPPGFWFASFLVADGFARFFLDFLRVSDTRYAGLTPAQYFGVATILAGGGLLFKARRSL